MKHLLGYKLPTCLEIGLKTIHGKMSSILQFSTGLTGSVWLPGLSI